MEPAELETLLKENINLDEAHVKTDGTYVEVIAVGEVFTGLNRVKRQQLVYAPLQNAIADGTLHAVTIKTFTPDEWQRDKKLVMPG